MYVAGMLIPDICEELGYSKTVITNDLYDAGVYSRKRNGLYRELGDCFTTDDVLLYRMKHPAGSTVEDQDGKVYIVKQAFPYFCKVEGKTFTWIELARVEWRNKHGKNPRTQWSG